MKTLHLYNPEPPDPTHVRLVVYQEGDRKLGSPPVIRVYPDGPKPSIYESLSEAKAELGEEGYVELVPEIEVEQRIRETQAQGLGIFVGSVVLIAGLLWINAQKLPLLGPQLGWSFAAVVLAIAAGSLAYWLAMRLKPASRGLSKW